MHGSITDRGNAHAILFVIGLILSELSLWVWADSADFAQHLVQAGEVTGREFFDGPDTQDIFGSAQEMEGTREEKCHLLVKVGLYLLEDGKGPLV